MSLYNPDRWVAIRFLDDQEQIIKILGAWHGGYLDSDSWRLSSGVKSVKEEGDYYVVENHSGSIYNCHKQSEGVTSYSGSILQSIGEKYKVERVHLDQLVSEGSQEKT